MPVEAPWRGCPLLWLQPLVEGKVLLEEAPGRELLWLKETALGATPLTA